MLQRVYKPDKEGYPYITMVALSCSPAAAGDDCVALCVYRRGRCFAVARPGTMRVCSCFGWYADALDEIEKMEQEKLVKLARKGPSPGEQGSSTPGTDLKAEAGPTAGVSTDKNKNYAVIAGAIGVAGVIAWYLPSKTKKSEEVAN
uniref:Uncharacterized protein n=1 Tax=Leersia perrieri TaxID=77586 RepID=A0A0D9WW96_9ORYZ